MCSWLDDIENANSRINLIFVGTFHPYPLKPKLYQIIISKLCTNFKPYLPWLQNENDRTYVFVSLPTVLIGSRRADVKAIKLITASLSSSVIKVMALHCK